MPISQELLNLLACPACKTRVEYVAEREGLACRACALFFPIRDGIPVMLLEEAEREPGPSGGV